MKRVRNLIITALFLTLPRLVNAQGAADCVDFVVVCGSSTLLLNGSGVGIDDFASANNQRPDCGFSESQSLWLKVPIEQDGTLEFVISSNNGQDDFDFAIYGPNRSCNNLGPSIRCSSTNPQSAGTPATTGLRAGENETSDGPGNLGNGFVDPLDVKAGEEYIILIDNFDQTNAGFELIWGGSSNIVAPPVANNPGTQEFCDADRDGELVVDISDLSDRIAGIQLGVSVSYFQSENDALLDINALNSRQVEVLNGGTTLYAKVTATSSGCNDIVAFDVVINNAPVVEEVSGPASVCPSVDGVPYTTTDLGLEEYEWIVAGGIVSAGQGTPNITIDWGGTNDSALIKLVGKDQKGCVSDTSFYPVKINTRLEPETPKGPTMVCFNERLGTIYSVTQVPGSVYEWSIQNGTIVGATDENSVEVRWDEGATAGKVSLKEFNPSIAECEGFSDIVDIDLLPEISISTIVNQVACAGDNNGRISLTVSGGSGAVDVQWSDNVAGTLREDLPPGDYQYTATDALGCSVTATVSVTEPDPIDLTDLRMVRTSCFENSDGGLTATITGGTGDYRYTIGGVTRPVTGDAFEVLNLSKGTYDLLILDETNCSFSTTITVDAPELLEADLESLVLQPTCPGIATGALSINALGGTPDYQFFWSPGDGSEGAFIDELSSGLYTVRIVDANGCETSLTATVEEIQPRVQLPDAFSPNGDDNNDTYAPVSNCPLGQYQLSVYNRWGNIVFFTTDQSQGWDGRVDGIDAPDGRYTYQLSYRISVNGELLEENILGVLRMFR